MSEAEIQTPPLLKSYSIQDCSRCEDGILMDSSLPNDPEFLCEACLLRTQVEGLQFLYDTANARIQQLEAALTMFGNTVLSAVDAAYNDAGMITPPSE